MGSPQKPPSGTPRADHKSGTPGGAPGSQRLPSARRVALGGLALALVASAVLAADHLALFGAALPGCGAAGGCERLTGGALGRVPGTDWPWSFFGLMYFAALLVALRGTTSVPLWLRRVAPLGALASLGLVGVMLRAQEWCPWCLATHVGNLTACVALWRLPGHALLPWRRALPFALTFAALGALLGVSAHLRAGAMQAAREQAAQVDTAAIVSGAGRRALTGRWTLGPADAPIRVVVFSDYECPWCRQLEGELTALISSRTDVSGVMKHFPMGQECQPDLPKDAHPDACRAARLAEAAGLLGGNDAFWATHSWLFARGGHFDGADLAVHARLLGLDPAALVQRLEQPSTLALIEADVAEAHELGILKTPMVFINGVELRAWDAPQALTRAVEALAAAQARGEADVHDATPPDALHKSVDDWRAEPRQALPADLVGWTWTPGASDDAGDGAGDGPTAPTVEVVLWGDLTQPQTRELLGLLDRARGNDVSLRFRHNPVDQGCIPIYATPGRATGACRAALVADAAGLLGGARAYRLACRTLAAMTGDLDAQLDDDALQALALEWGLDPVALRVSARQPGTAAAVTTDIEAARKLSMNRVPMLFVNGRWAPRWRLPRDHDAGLVDALLDAARADATR